MFRKDRSISFHASLTAIFLTLICTLVGIVTWYNYAANAATATASARLLLQEVNHKIVERYQRTHDPIHSLATILSAESRLRQHPSETTPYPGLDDLFQTILQYPQIFSLYVGYDNGDFLQLVNLDSQPRFKQSLQPPEQAHFGVLTVIARSGQPSFKQWSFLDVAGNKAGSHPPDTTTFDPRQRPWFIASPDDRDVKVSDPYIYHSIRKPGITFSHRLQGKESGGVFGIDITLSHLSEFLQHQQFSPSSQILFFNRKGEVIVHPDESRTMQVFVNDLTGATTLKIAKVTDLRNPVIEELVTRHLNGSWVNGTIFPVHGQQHIGLITPLPERYARETMIAVTVPVSEFLGPIADTGIRGLFFSLCALALTLPITWLVSRRFTSKLRQLAQETSRIQQFQLEGPVPVHSHITEIRALTQSIGAMKNALNIFGQYVPKALVRQLIATGENIGRHSERREITLLFTDVGNFTHLAESLPPEQLTDLVSEYLREMTKSILEHGGTIDKYIGDAIMAFWNAPQRTDQHSVQACIATLACAHASNALNRVWQERGQPVLPTRFGLHTGEVIIGNIGSPDRMDYTAMGAAVNLASRVEGLNKVYGTQILITDAVAKRLEPEFVTRQVDLAVPKGATQPVPLYELLGLREGPRHLLVTDHQLAELSLWAPIFVFYQARQWSKALEACRVLLAHSPNSGLGNLYRQRCMHFMQSPPPENWDGAKHFRFK
ncbi:MAG: hypothetical protein HQM03_00415 [Magnetococcales bacterium]|nr:hypothetical protein [Magnetococcales bacterium]